MFTQHKRLLAVALFLSTTLLLLPLLRPAVQAQAGGLAVSQPRLVFSTLQGASSATKSVTITNVGSSSLALGAPVLQGADTSAFTIEDSGGLPRTLAPSEALNVGVSFNPAASAAVAPNDPAQAATLAIAVSGGESLTIGLAGLALRGLSGPSEPSLQEILDGYQLTIDVDDADPYTNALGRSALQWGDEIPAQQLRKAGPGPVSVEVVAVFGPKGDDTVARFGWYTAASPATRNELFSVPREPQAASNNNATLQPAVVGAQSFDPGGEPFGVYSLWPFFDAAGDEPRSQADALNTWEPNLSYRHKVRVYPYRSALLGDEPNAMCWRWKSKLAGKITRTLWGSCAMCSRCRPRSTWSSTASTLVRCSTGLASHWASSRRSPGGTPPTRSAPLAPTIQRGSRSRSVAQARWWGQRPKRAAHRARLRVEQSDQRAPSPLRRDRALHGDDTAAGAARQSDRQHPAGRYFYRPQPDHLCEASRGAAEQS
ncbi:hypothetical protein HC891_11765 [Candidatus Gracilibacteria bacterium]|nr:hypothetical protein [Candidatus Gracilibacteria bacterium]